MQVRTILDHDQDRQPTISNKQVEQWALPGPGGWAVAAGGAGEVCGGAGCGVGC